MGSSFPDVTVWLALAVEDHVHHQRALTWWETQEDEILFCRFTQMALLRLLTTSAMMAGQPLTMLGAWSVYDSLSSDPRVQLRAEPNSVEGQFRRLTSIQEPSPKLWMDLYLQCFAESTGATLVTFDRRLAGRTPSTQLLT